MFACSSLRIAFSFEFHFVQVSGFSGLSRNHPVDHHNLNPISHFLHEAPQAWFYSFPNIEYKLK